MSSIAPQMVRPQEFTPAQHQTWMSLYERQADNRFSMATPEFCTGLEILGISGNAIPDLNEINRRLMARTGWQGVPVSGLEPGESFYPMLAKRQYPIGWFIRDPQDLNYTPAPDIFHDLYGHMPFFVDPAYADFCADFGRRASRYLDNPVTLQEFERLFWFTIEFGLIKNSQGTRIFGGGLLSSYSESIFALSQEPKVIPFSLEAIRRQPYRTDEFQRTLFLLPSREALFSCLDAYEACYR